MKAAAQSVIILFGTRWCKIKVRVTASIAVVVSRFNNGAKETILECASIIMRNL